MKKRITALLLSLALLLPMLCVTASAEEMALTVDGGYLLYQVSGGEVTITGFTGSPGNVVIPDYVDGCPVVRIQNSAMAYCDSMTGLSLPSTLREIGDMAFMGCGNLESALLPNGLSVLGQNAFASCYSLGEISVPGSVKEISSGAFANCFSAQRVTLGEGISMIYENAFYNCTQFTTLTIPKSMNYIEPGAFEQCDGLSTLILSFNYNALYTDSFRGCPNLTEVYIDLDRATWEWKNQIDPNIFPSNPTIHCSDDADNSSYTVTFDPRGGTVSPTTQEVTNGETYGTLPIPTWRNHTFDGWFTKPDGGAQVTAQTPVSLTGDQVLYAHWLSAPEVHTILFDAGGGSVSPASKNVTWGMNYGVLPTPVRDGYTFLGWYTDRYSGESVNSLDTFTGDCDLTLYAHWEQSGRAYTVTFDAAGGSVDPESKQVISGQSYGDLPTPIYRGHAFDGWYTQLNGGQRILSTHTAELTANQTLYAHWHETSEDLPVKTPTFDKLRYEFDNSTVGFDYPDHYNVPLERYLLMYGDTQRAREVYAIDTRTEWGGNCFGMSSTTNLFFQESNTISPSSFRSGANASGDLSIWDRNSSLGLTVREFVEAMQIGQRSVPINRAYTQNRDDVNGMVRAVQNFHDTGVNPPVIDVFGLSPNGSLAGHAIVGYEVVDRSATESWIMVYDCNHPDEPQHITLTKNSQGRYIAWSYDISFGYPTWGTGRSQSYMTYIPYSAYYQTWIERGNFSDAQVMFTTNARSYTVNDRNGSTVATVRNGQLVDRREDVYPIIEVAATPDGLTHEITGTSLWLPTDVYTVSNTGSTGGEFEATLIHVNQSATISTSATSVTLAVDDGLGVNYARVGDPNSRYFVSLRSSLDVGKENVEMRGTTSGTGVSLSQIGGSLYTEGGSGQSVSSLVVDGKQTGTGALIQQNKNVTELVTDSTVMPFRDVAKGNDWFYDDVQYVYRQGLMNGTAPDLFAPHNTVNRGMIATILYRLAGSPAVGAPKFADVKAGEWYADAARWAVDNGIMNDVVGYFYPNSTIDREDMALTLYRFARYQGWNVSQRADLSKYADQGQISGYALEALSWANAVGLINGTSPTTLAPGGTTTRCVLSALLHRFCEQIEK